MFDEIVDKEKENIINTTCELIKIPSVSIENDNSPDPFGKNCTKALETFLDIASKLEFKTKNLDNYCGYAEFGEGEELVGIIGHLDVVPALEEDGWTSPPFFPTIKDGKLFGRGAIDDKGPVVSALYAMKAIKDSVEINKRIRLIVGLNEEKSWKCINYYKKVEEFPTIGFSPDANFPAIYAEKGIMSIKLENSFEIKNFEILDIDCKSNAMNVVPKYCSITLKSLYLSEKSYLQFIDTLSKNAKSSKIKLSIKNDIVKIESFGIASHAAHPELGENAITNLVEYLINNFEFSNNYLIDLYNNGIFDIESPKFLSETKLEDESGILTSNVAILEYKEKNLILKINLRIPISIKLNSLKEKYEKLIKILPQVKISFLGIQEPLFVDKNSYLVKTLVNIFNAKTGKNEKPIAIGGGTYARAFDNFISYGMTMPHEQDMCHQVDEYVSLDNLILSTKIYAEAIYQLGTKGRIFCPKTGQRDRQ